MWVQIKLYTTPSFFSLANSVSKLRSHKCHDGKSEVKRLYGQKETKRQWTANGCEEEAVRYWER